MSKQKKQLLIALISALIATAALFAYTATISSQAQTDRMKAIEEYGGETTSVVVTTKDVGAGQTLDESNTVLSTWLVDLLPQAKVATQLKQVRGQIAACDLKKNEPILLSRTGNNSSRISVPAGLEAVSVSSDDVLAVGGAIQAGSFVDVYVETVTGTIKMLGQNILVLETSDSSTEDAAKETIAWVTLAVTPESVEELINASSKGAIHLALPGQK